eukprot:TRINITY_DN11876_c0_g1_i1.p1 TRINITY_DN11876_c0_g1~~TRINITY_DN11876_c0_g1_i1.p1  ORF type:complete len:155 (+),score=27.43 TRINITY_DN11876_c0_g1_i1:42-506(+)
MFSTLAFLAVSVFQMCKSVSVIPESCSQCVHPRYPPLPPNSGYILYLPHCVDNQTYNFCDAVCLGLKFDGKASAGDCTGCSRKCSRVFKPVCNSDQTILYTNKCEAECAGADYADCQGLSTVIPGKSPLPPSHLLPVSLQGVYSQGDQTEDEDI